MINKLKKIQVMLDKETYSKLEELSKENYTSISSIGRKLIENALKS